MKMSQTIWRMLAVTAGLWLAGCGRREAASPAAPPAASAQTTTNAESDVFQAKVPYDAPYFGKTKMELSGRTPNTTASSAELPIKDFKVKFYRPTGELQMTLEAPECLVNLKEKQGSSSGPLKMETGDGQFVTEGTGFLWRQKDTNATLTISNRVVTTVKKELLAGEAPTNAPGAATLDPSQFVRIHSDSASFDQNTSLVRYTGNVRVEDDKFDMSCGLINLHRSEKGDISDLFADQNIVIVHKLTKSRTTGEHAVYTAGDNGAQLLTLTGNPRWQSSDGLNEGTAKTFILDRGKAMRNTFRAQDEAHFRLPLTSGADSGFLFLPTAAAPNAAGSSSNLVDIQAGVITLDLPSTNGGGQEVQAMLAEKNVVIVDSTGGKALGDRASYSAATGGLELSGKASYESSQILTRAEVLTLNKLTKAVSGRTNAYVKLLTTALKGTAGFGDLFAGRASQTTNQFVEVTANSYDLQNDQLTFREKVKAAYSQDNASLGTLDCGVLVAVFQSNLIQRVLAEQAVTLHRPPTPDAHGNLMQGDFKTDRLEMQMGAGGLLRSATATGHVLVTGIETPAKGGKPVHSSFAADTLNTLFRPNMTNQVEMIVADHHVVLTRDDATARGDKAVYTAANETAILTGKPEVQIGDPQAQPEHARVVSDDAIVYDIGRGMIRAQGNPRTSFTRPIGGSNAANLPGIFSNAPK